MKNYTHGKGIFLKGRGYVLTVAVTAAAILINPALSLAADDNDYAALEKRLKAVEKQLLLQAKVINAQQKTIEKISNIAPDIKEMIVVPEATVRVDKFVLNGANLFTPDDFDPLLSKYRGKELTVTQLKDIAYELTAFYRSMGYVSSQAYLSTQEISDNTVEFGIIEGRIGEVIIEGGKHFKAGLIARQISLEDGQILDYDALNKDIRRINRHPDRTVQAVLKPGEEKGTSDVVVKIKEEKRPWHFLADYSNRGTKYTTRNRFGAGFVHNNFLGNEDILTLKGRVGERTNVNSYSGDYNTPLSMLGLLKTRIGGYFARSNSVIGGIFQVLNPMGSATAWGLYVTHTWLDTDWVEPFPLTLGSIISIGFDSISARNEMLNKETSRDEIRAFKAGLSFDEKDEWGRTYFSESFHFGLDGFAGSMKRYDPGSSRLDASSRFFKNTGTFTRITRLPFSSYLVNSAKYQVTTEPLLQTEQFVIGGADTVRGYPENEYFGDVGFCSTMELRTPAFIFPDSIKVPFDSETSLRDAIQFAGFVDWGKAILLKPRSGEEKDMYLVGAGFGVMIDLYDSFNGRIDFGFPVNKSTSDETASTVHMSMGYKW